MISKVSGKPLTEKADEMWKWWDDINETEYQKYKTERYKKTTYAYTVPTYTPRHANASSPAHPSPLKPARRPSKQFASAIWC